MNGVKGLLSRCFLSPKGLERENDGHGGVYFDGVPRTTTGWYKWTGSPMKHPVEFSISINHIDTSLKKKYCWNFHLKE